MTRNDIIRESFNKSMRIIEIGPSYNPIVPKAEGWRTTVVDHASKAELIAKYQGDPNVLDVHRTEEVDIIRSDGPLHEDFRPEQHHSYDGLIASHVIEHIPDLIAFLNSVAILLKPNGICFLAVPDKRLCFDFFQPLTTTGDLLDGMGRTRHSRGTLFDNHAYYARRGDEAAWASVAAGGQYAPFTLANRLEDLHYFVEQTDSVEYVDSHTWRFTPSSFELLILELNRLGLIPWRIAKLMPMAGIEFLVWLEIGDIALSADAVHERRLDLLRETIMETKEQIAQLEPPVAEIRGSDTAPIDPTSMPTISAIIPLYNGERFIEEAINSVLQQTLPATEIIVVDDGSPDEGRGADIVRRLAAQHPSIRLLNKKNGGQSSARNYGFAHSTGELIAFLDQDDAWYPSHLAELVKPFLEAPPAGREIGWVYSNLDEIDAKGNMIGHNFLRSHATPHPKRDMFQCLREDMFVLPSASLISRKAFEQVGGFDETLSGYEDDDLFLRLFRAGYDNVFLETALSRWRIYPDSSSYSYRMRRSRMNYFRKLWDSYQDDPQRARWIKRDVLIPRFYSHAVSEYVKAVRSGDAATIEETRRDLMLIVSRMPGWRQKLFPSVLARIHSEKMMNAAFTSRRYLVPLARRLRLI